MAIIKRKYASGHVTWGYVFDAPVQKGQKRRQVVEAGFDTKRKAQDAEADRRIAVQKEREAAVARQAAPLPRTLRQLLVEFCSEYGDRHLARKTMERYREQIPYLATELLDTAVEPPLSPLQFTREWNRLKDCGGHYRKTRVARPLSAKTVRNIAGFVSKAMSWAISQEILKANPVKSSELPKKIESEAAALTVTQQVLLLEATGHWALPIILELSAGTGARRGEVLALRWPDLQDGRLLIARSLSQTKEGLCFKGTKTGKARTVRLPPSTLAALEDHRKSQDAWRAQFGATYRGDLDLIIANPDGTPLRPNSISSAVSALCRRLKLPKGVSLHTLRHTHGTHLLAGGMELPAVSKRLGHSSTHVTAKVYAHVLPGRDDEAAKLWEKFQGRTAQEESPKSRRVS